MNKYFYTSICCLFTLGAFAQNVGVNTTFPTSSLDINGGLRLRSEATGVAGTSVVLPGNQSNHILTGAPSGVFTITLTGTVQEGQHVIITNTNIVHGTLGGEVIPAGATTELIYVNGGWKKIGSSEAVTNNAWGVSGNTAAFTNFIGTTNDVPLRFRTSNADAGGIGRWGNVVLGGARSNIFFAQVSTGSVQNTAIGNAALQNGTVMYGNTAVGFSASQMNENGHNNTAIGHNALNKNKNGTYVVAIGKDALLNDTEAEQTVAVGGNALYWNNNRFGNTAVGTNTLFHNSNPDLGALTATQALHNTAMGHSALFSNRSGSGSVAIGYQAAFSDSKADGVIAIGRAALYYSNNRARNTAIGDSALFSNGQGAINQEGNANTAVGANALSKNTKGYSNTAVGTSSLTANNTGVGNTALGSSALPVNTTGNSNTAIGFTSLFLNEGGSSNIAIGHRTLQSNTAGFSNVAVGVYALAQNTTQSNLVAIGDSALYWNGFDASSSQGVKNTGIGSKALYNNRLGEGNVALGYNAGFNELGSNKLYIQNSDANKDNALIYGDFAADSLLLNAKTINKFSLNVRGSNAIEMGYGANNKQMDAGKICYGCFGDPAHWLGIVGGGTAALGGDRVIKLWSEGGLRIKGNAMPDFGSTYTLGNTASPWRSATTDSVRSNAYMLRNSAMHIVGASGELVFRLNNIDIAKISSGGIAPAADNDIYLGNPSRRFVSVYATIGVIQTSDANLKTNIQPTQYGLDEVLALNPVEYNWKDNPSGEKMVGLLAQEVQKIIPEAVVTPEDGSPLGMKYNELIPVLVKAIQEQQKKIEELEKALKKLQK